MGTIFQFTHSPFYTTIRQWFLKLGLFQYLAIEGQKLPPNQTFLATSDIIESIFGKYKIFSDSSPCSEIAVRPRRRGAVGLARARDFTGLSGTRIRFESQPLPFRDVLVSPATYFLA